MNLEVVILTVGKDTTVVEDSIDYNGNEAIRVESNVGRFYKKGEASNPTGKKNYQDIMPYDRIVNLPYGTKVKIIEKLPDNKEIEYDGVVRVSVPNIIRTLTGHSYHYHVTIDL